jgi:hypothetical protein
MSDFKPGDSSIYADALLFFALFLQKKHVLSGGLPP